MFHIIALYKYVLLLYQRNIKGQITTLHENIFHEETQMTTFLVLKQLTYSFNLINYGVHNYVTRICYDQLYSQNFQSEFCRQYCSALTFSDRATQQCVIENLKQLKISLYVWCRGNIFKDFLIILKRTLQNYQKISKKYFLVTGRSTWTNNSIEKSSSLKVKDAYRLPDN